MPTWAMVPVRMRGVWRLLDRFVILGVCLILGVSTGVASVATGETVVTAGHVAYVSLVREAGSSGGVPAPPVEYGLASLRSTALLGLYERSRPLDDGKNHMVFAWSSDRPDPRGDPSLQPTGKFAKIADKNGHTWTLYELTYSGADTLPPPPGIPYLKGPHTAYGVRVGPVVADPDIDAGRYNYVLSYRFDSLFPEAFGPAATPRTAPPPVQPLDALPGGDPVPYAADLHAEPGPVTLEVAIGAGKAPLMLRLRDPATPHGTVALP